MPSVPASYPHRNLDRCSGILGIVSMKANGAVIVGYLHFMISRCGKGSIIRQYRDDAANHVHSW